MPQGEQEMETGQVSSSALSVNATNPPPVPAPALWKHPFEEPKVFVEIQSGQDEPESPPGPLNGVQPAKPVKAPKQDKGKKKSVKRPDENHRSLNRMMEEKKRMFSPLIREIALKVGRHTHWEELAVDILTESAVCLIVQTVRGEPFDL